MIYTLTTAVVAVTSCQFAIFLYANHLKQKIDIQEIIKHILNPSGAPFALLYIVMYYLSGKMPAYYYNKNLHIDPLNILLKIYVVDFFMFIIHMSLHMRWFGNYLYIKSHAPHHKHTKPVMTNAFDGSYIDTLMMIIVPLYITSKIVHLNATEYIIFGCIYSSILTLIHSHKCHIWENTFMWKILRLGTSSAHRIHHKNPKKCMGHLTTLYDDITTLLICIVHHLCK